MISITSPLCITAITALTFCTNCNYSDLLYGSDVHNHRRACPGGESDKYKCRIWPSSGYFFFFKDPGKMSWHTISLLTAVPVTQPLCPVLNQRSSLFPPTGTIILSDCFFFKISYSVYMHIRTLAHLWCWGSLCIFSYLTSEQLFGLPVLCHMIILTTSTGSSLSAAAVISGLSSQCKSNL